ncbi:PAS domain S-box protein [bacterium]|nr:MAG: PAS domain S-box protein [bacterium]
MPFTSLEQVFSKVVEDSPDELVVIDRDFIFRSANEAYVKSRGLEASDVIGRRVAEVLGENVFETAVRPYVERSLKGESVSRNSWVDYPSCGRRYLEVRFYPLAEGEKGEIKQVLLVLRDRTKEKKTEEALFESEKAYRDLFNAMDEGFALAEAILDGKNNLRDFRLLRVNDSFHKLTGIPPCTATSKTALELLPNADIGWLEPFAEVVRTGQPKRFEKYSRELGGKWFEVHAFPVEEGKFGFCFSDVTAKKQSEETGAWLASFPAQNPYPIAEVDFEGRVHYMNPAAETLLPDLWERGAGHPWLADLGFAVRSFEAANEQSILRETRVGERCFQQMLHYAAQTHRIRIYGLEITERKRQEEQLLRLNRAQKALNDSTHALLHATTEEKLLEDVCRIIIEDCGYKMAWIGYVENDKAGSVRPVAWSGFESGYLESLNITLADPERGRGPTGTAIRTREPCFCRDILNDPRFEPWRKNAVERGYASSLALPLIDGGKAFGALMVYSTEKNPFTEAETALLKDLAADLSYGIGTMRLRAAHALGEEALKESEERFRKMFERHRAIMLIVDPASGCIVDANAAAAAFYGHSREKLRTMRVQEINRLSPEEVDAELQKAMREERNYFVFPHRVGNDEVRWVEVYSTPFDVNGQTLLFSVIHDVTERKRYELEILQARNAAAAANSAKSDFLARMSHEIRTPMNGVIGMTELALMEELSPKAREYLALVKYSARSLLDIVNDILDFSKIEAGKVELHCEDFNLLEKLGTVFSTLGAIASQKGVSLYRTISHDVPKYVCGDWGRLGQILTNVIGNAIKFTEDGSVSVKVTLDTAPPATTAGRFRLLFEVSDTGVGIPCDKLETIFDPFYQSGLSHHAKHGGTGLGLNISRQLVTLMQGRIWANSEPGSGSTFFITAEFEEAAAPPAVRDQPEAKATEPRPSGLRILLAEDEPVNQMVGRDLLESEGHIVTVAANGQKALEALAKEPFDLVLMDIQMPVLGGLETTRRIREGTIPGIPPDILIVALTAHAITGDREKFLAASMDDYVTKPIDVDEIYRVLEETAGKRQKRKDE